MILEHDIPDFPVPNRVTLPSDLGEVRSSATDRFVIAVSINPATSADDEVIEAMQDLVAIFCSASRRVLFGRIGQVPSTALQASVEWETLGADEFSFVVDTRGVGILAYRVLMSLLAQAHFYIVSFAEMRVDLRAWPFSARAALHPLEIGFTGEDEKEIEAVRLAELSDPLGVSVFTIRLNLGSVEAETVFEEIEDALADWDSLLLMGGFKRRFDEPDALDFETGGTTVTSRYEIEHQVERFNGDSDAILALYGVIAWIDSSIVALRSVEIE